MKENLLDKLISAKKDYEIGQVIFFNDGSTQTENNSFARKMNDICDTYELDVLVKDMVGATAVYSRQFEVDTMEVGLLLGLIYKKEDVLDNNQVKEGAQPVNNIVRYYDVGFNSYSDGEKTNTYDYSKHNFTHQGYIHYDKLVKAFENSGVEYTGPKTFNEFKEAIQSGEVFDISLIAELSKGKTKSLHR